MTTRNKVFDALDKTFQTQMTETKKGKPLVQGENNVEDDFQKARDTLEKQCHIVNMLAEGILKQ